MKKFAAFLILAVLGVAIYRHYFAEPTPGEKRAMAQKSALGVVGYWVEALREHRDADVKTVCHSTAWLKSKEALDALRRKESQMHTYGNATTQAPMKEPGKFKATISSSKGTLFEYTVKAAEKDGKYWIFEVASPELAL